VTSYDPGGDSLGICIHEDGLTAVSEAFDCTDSVFTDSGQLKESLFLRRHDPSVVVHDGFRDSNHILEADFQVMAGHHLPERLRILNELSWRRP
jgi:hypothetical protein